jgi:hypothetical protein
VAVEQRPSSEPASDIDRSIQGCRMNNGKENEPPAIIILYEITTGDKMNLGRL